MPTFRCDNTEGYSAKQLAELNRRYDERIATLTDDERAEKSLTDHIAEQIRVDFDIEIAA